MSKIVYSLEHRTSKKNISIRGTLVIGREGADLGYANDEKMSRQHCKIFLDAEGRLFVEDFKATNKTWVNERPLEEGAVSELKIGDSLRVGEQVFDVVFDQQNRQMSSEATLVVQRAVKTERMSVASGRSKKLFLWLVILFILTLLVAMVFFPEKLESFITNFHEISEPRDH